MEMGDDHHDDDEATPQVHPAGAPADHHDAEAPAQTAPRMVEHRHADGTVESHPAAEPETPPADDGNEHSSLETLRMKSVRSEERRVGKECVSPGRSLWSPNN